MSKWSVGRCREGKAEIYDDDGVFAYVNYDETTRDLTIARLIAAAPDLLEACETIVQLGKSRYHDLGIDRMVEAAIAKARGTST